MTTTAFRRAERRPQPKRRYGRSDWPLVIGLLFFGGLLLLAAYGPLVAPHDLYYSRSLLDGQAPPFPPSAQYPFGSDIVGRDRLSWLLIGARGSVLIAVFAAALRMGIGATLGIIAGFAGGLLAAILRRTALGVSSIPGTIAALLAVIVLGANPEQFVIAFGLVGWAEPFHQARRYARSEGARPFMESARSLGLSNRRLLFGHLLPNVAPQLLTTAAFQVSAVFLLMAELALLNIFVGGAIIIDYDARGNPIVAPRLANWASMLAATRPIVSLYGDLASILLPATALLSAVLATNLFGDALAARAQRLDIYRLFSRRQVLGLVALGAAIAVSVNAWPNRLAPEIAYAQGFDAAGARALAIRLASMSSDESGEATFLAGRLGGEFARTTESFFRATRTDLSIGGVSLPADAYAIDEADASGPLVYVDAQTLLAGRLPDAVDGAIVLVTQPIRGTAFERLRSMGARALVAVDGGPYFQRDHGVYPLPVVGTTRVALVRALGRPLPDLRSGGDRFVVLAGDAHVRVVTERRDLTVTDIVARTGSSDLAAPIVMLVASYDATSADTWSRATAAAMLVSVVEHFRTHPLPIEVIAIATSADAANYAGLRLALANLRADEMTRVETLVLIGPQLSTNVVLSVQPIPGAPSGTGRLAARIADALGVTLTSSVATDLVRTVGSSGVAVPPLIVTADGNDAEPERSAFEEGASVILSALAYVPAYQPEMR